MSKSAFDDQKQRDTVRAAESAKRSEQSRLDTEFVMSDARGRRFVAAILEQAHIFRSSMAAEAMPMAFAEGERNLGLKLLSRLTTDTPSLYLTMEKERVNG